jgi:hypothetical protein
MMNTVPMQLPINNFMVISNVVVKERYKVLKYFWRCGIC